MFLFIVAVALVVVASLIFVFTKDWNEEADYPDEALQEEERAYRRKKSAVRKTKKSAEKKEGPAPEPSSQEKDWIEAMITEIPEEGPEEIPVQVKGMHEAEETPPKEPLIEPLKQPLEEASPLILPFEEKTIKAPGRAAVVKAAPEKKKENYGSLKPFSPKEEKPHDEGPPLIPGLKIICGFIAAMAFISTVIIWGMIITRLGG